jgi:hypothetical protein
MSKSYHKQFRENQRNKNSNGLLSNSKAKFGNKLPEQRPTAVVKQPSRSDTFTLPKNSNETNSKVPKVNQTQNAPRRQAVREQPPVEQKRTQAIRKNGDTRPMLKRPDKFIDQEDPQRHPVRFTNQEDLQRNPVRFTNQYNNTYSPSPPVYYQKPVPVADPLPHDTLDRSRRVLIDNNQYIIRRQKKQPADDYTDYHTVSDILTISSINKSHRSNYHYPSPKKTIHSSHSNSINSSFIFVFCSLCDFTFVSLP